MLISLADFRPQPSPTDRPAPDSAPGAPDAVENALRSVLGHLPGLRAVRLALPAAAPLMPARALLARDLNGFGLAVDSPAVAQALRTLGDLERDLVAAFAEVEEAGPLLVSLARSMNALDACGLAGQAAGRLLRHLDLHARAELAPAQLRSAAGAAVEWAETGLRGWREWSDRRFGPIRCLRWDAERRYCEQLGYRYEERDYPIHYLMERIQHQQRAWAVLLRARLMPLLSARAAWSQL